MKLENSNNRSVNIVVDDDTISFVGLSQQLRQLIPVYVTIAFKSRQLNI